MAKRQQAIKYLRDLGYTSPDEQEIQTAMKDVKTGTALPSLPALGGGLTLDQPDLTLPDIGQLRPENQLSLALKQMSNLAMREGRVTGLAATTAFFQERGIMPEDLPGGSIAQMLSFVDRAMVDPVKERAQSIAEMVNAFTESKRELQRSAEKQIDFLVGNDMWNTLDSGSRQDLWDIVGYPGRAQTISSKGISSSDLMKFYVPGYSPEMGYHLWTSSTPPAGFREEAEMRMKAEGRFKEDMTLTEWGAQKEWDRLRENLKKTDLKIGDLSQDDQWDVFEMNAALKRIYEITKQEWDDYWELNPRIREQRGMEEPRNPMDVVNEQIRAIRRSSPEFIPFINLPK